MREYDKMVYISKQSNSNLIDYYFKSSKIENVLAESVFHRFDGGIFFDYLGVRNASSTDLIVEDAVQFIR